MARQENVQLTGERPTRSTGPRIVAVVLASLLATAVIVVSVGVKLRSANPSARLAVAKVKLATEPRENFDTVIIGDSSGLYAVIPGVTDSVLGGRAVNLCTVTHHSTLGYADLLRRYLRKSTGLSRVVLVRTPARPNARLGRSWALSMFSPEERRRFLFQSLTGGEIRLTPTDIVLPWYFGSVETKEFVLHFGRRGTDRLAFLVDRLLRQRGVAFLPDSGRLPENVDEYLQKFLERASRPYEPDYEADQGYEELLRLADLYDLKMYYAFGPVDSRAEGDEDVSRLVGGIGSHVRSKSYRDNRFELAFQEPMYVDPALIHDNGAHLTESGARIYTRALADSILAHEQRSRN